MPDRPIRPAAALFATIKLIAQPAACPRGRLYVRDCLAGRGLPEGLVDTVTLLTSEVISNALLHAPPPLSLELRVSRERVRVEVTDSDPALPVRRRLDLETEDGRGLWLLERLSTAWGYQLAGTGKRVWFEVAAPAQPV